MDQTEWAMTQPHRDLASALAAYRLVDHVAHWQWPHDTVVAGPGRGARVPRIYSASDERGRKVLLRVLRYLDSWVRVARLQGESN